MTRRLRTDDRGVSTLVNHILAIGITSLLIVGLLTAGSSYIQNQQQFAGQDGLETVGNELARDVTQLLRLSAGDGEATITTELPERIAGRSYNAEVRDGSACDQQASTPESCLVLDINGLDVTRNVPLSVDESNISMNRLGAGRYQLDYTGSGLGEADADSDVTRLSLRVGIGDDVQQEREGGNIVGQTNLPPTNVSFEMDPEWPDSSRDIEFTADAVDPDATNPGDPGMNYSWDFDSDGAYEKKNRTTKTVTHRYGNYGRKNVTLRVTDERGASTWESKNISVGGLEYVSTATSTDREEVTFQMHSTYPSSVEITVSGLYFRPVDGANRIEVQDKCTQYYDPDDRDHCRDYENRPEIRIDNPLGGEWDAVYDFAGEDEYAEEHCYEDGVEIPETGLVVSSVYNYDILGYDRYGDPVCTLDDQRRVAETVQGGEEIEIQFRGITGLSKEQYVFGIEYIIEENGNTYTNVTRFDTRNVP